MKSRIVLALAALLFLNLGASAQSDHRGRDQRTFFNRGYDSGHRRMAGRNCHNTWKTRYLQRDGRRGFERGFQEGPKQDRLDRGSQLR